VLIGVLSPLIYLIPDSIGIEGYAISGLAVLGVGTGINIMIEVSGGSVESPSLLTPFPSSQHNASLDQAEDEDLVLNDLSDALTFDIPLDALDELPEETPALV